MRSDQRNVGGGGGVPSVLSNCVKIGTISSMLSGGSPCSLVAGCETDRRSLM